jgi:hypothetical protein
LTTDRPTKDSTGAVPRLSAKGQADAADKESRLAQQLRANLLRRKSQQRARRDESKPTDAEEG